MLEMDELIQSARQPSELGTQYLHFVEKEPAHLAGKVKRRLWRRAGTRQVSVSVLLPSSPNLLSWGCWSRKLSRVPLLCDYLSENLAHLLWQSAKPPLVSWLEVSHPLKCWKYRNHTTPVGAPNSYPQKPCRACNFSAFKLMGDKEVTERGGPFARARECFEVLKLGIFLSTNVWLSFTLWCWDSPIPPSPPFPRQQRDTVWPQKTGQNTAHTMLKKCCC